MKSGGFVSSRRPVVPSGVLERFPTNGAEGLNYSPLPAEAYGTSYAELNTVSKCKELN